MPAGNLNGTIVPMSGDSLIDGMTNGYKWQLDASRTVDWTLSDGFNYEYWGNPTDIASRFSVILSTVSYYANVKFNFLGYYSDPAVAYLAGSDINLALDYGARFDFNINVWASGAFPKPYDVNRGDIYVNMSSDANYISYEPGSAGWFLLIHELGHTLGLKHPHDGGGTGRPTFSELGWSDLDIDFWTVMSYDDNYDYNLVLYDPATPMVLDVLALQYLYGKNTKTNNTNSTFVLSDSSIYLTIYDAGGIDTINQSSADSGWYIVLPNLQITTLVDTKVGLAVPVSDIDLEAPTSLRWLMGDIENIKGSNYNDLLNGNDLVNRIEGGGGNDVIDGGAGADKLSGGLGDDFYYVDNAKDVVTESSFSGTDEVISSITYTLRPNLENITLSGTANLNATGNTLNNIITGNSGNNVLNGAAGTDMLIGALGDDSYVFDNIDDFVLELLEEGIDNVQSSVSVSGLFADVLTMAYIGDHLENITLTGKSAINATGNALNNIITGNASANTLSGGEGADTLIGGLGKDSLFGGEGNDSFKFNSIKESKLGANTRDVIADFVTGDNIDLSAIDAKTGETSNDVFTFLGSSAPTTTNANGALWFSNGVLYGSTDNDILAEFDITVANVSLMYLTDFIL